MDLKDFVSKTLSQIVEGIKEVQADQAGQNEVQRGGQRVGRVNPPLSTSQGVFQEKGLMVTQSGEPVEFVEFDIAVAAEEAAGAGVGVKVLGLSILYTT